MNGTVMKYSALDASEIRKDSSKKNENYLYIFKLCNTNELCFALTNVPTPRTSVEEYYDWLYEQTNVVMFNLVGFIKKIRNTDIEYTYNVSSEADRLGADLSTIDIKDFVKSFKGCKDCRRQIEWYLTYVKERNNGGEKD